MHNHEALFLSSETPKRQSVLYAPPFGSSGLSVDNVWEHWTVSGQHLGALDSQWTKVCNMGIIRSHKRPIVETLNFRPKGSPLWSRPKNFFLNFCHRIVQKQMKTYFRGPRTCSRKVLCQADLPGRVSGAALALLRSCSRAAPQRAALRRCSLLQRRSSAADLEKS